MKWKMFLVQNIHFLAISSQVANKLKDPWVDVKAGSSLTHTASQTGICMFIPIEAAYSLVMLICPRQPTQQLWMPLAAASAAAQIYFLFP